MVAVAFVHVAYVHRPCLEHYAQHVVYAVFAAFVLHLYGAPFVAVALLYVANTVDVAVPHLVGAVRASFVCRFFIVHGHHLVCGVAHDCVAHDEKAVGPFGTPCYEACAVGVFSHVCGVADVQRGRTGLEPYELPVEVQVIQQCLAAVERLVLGRALRVSGCGGKECEYYCQELFHFDRFLSSRCALRFKMVFFLSGFCFVICSGFCSIRGTERTFQGSSVSQRARSSIASG